MWVGISINNFIANFLLNVSIDKDTYKPLKDPCQLWQEALKLEHPRPKPPSMYWRNTLHGHQRIPKDWSLRHKRTKVGVRLERGQLAPSPPATGYGEHQKFSQQGLWQCPSSWKVSLQYRGTRWPLLDLNLMEISTVYTDICFPSSHPIVVPPLPPFPFPSRSIFTFLQSEDASLTECMTRAGMIRGTLSITKHIKTPPRGGPSHRYQTFTYTQNVVKFGHVVSETCKQFEMFLAIQAIIQTILKS